jgi:FkbM family methyltransferase
MESNPYPLSKSVAGSAGDDSTGYSQRGIIKSALKKLRSSQPFNFVATSTLRGLSRATGLRTELFVKHVHKVGRVSCELPNGRRLKLWSRGDDWVSNQIYWRGLDGYEPETVPLFFRLASRAGVTMDVGAYVGFFSLLAAHANPNGKVYAFEPLPKIHERLQKNVALNRLSNVECLRAAVGRAEGEAEFFHVDEGLPTSSSLSFEFMRTTRELRSTRVPVIMLDRFIKDKGLGRVDLVKIDTESTEPEVLSGMIEAIRRDRPLIVCEVLKERGSERLLEEILDPLGYRYYHLTPDGPVQKDHVAGHAEWLNYLFTTLGPDQVARL